MGRLFDGGSDPSHGRKMEDGSGAYFLDQSRNLRAIGDIQFLNRDSAANGLHIGLLPGAVVEIAEVVHTHHPGAPSQQRLGSVRADESRSAGDQDGWTAH